MLSSHKLVEYLIKEKFNLIELLLKKTSIIILIIPI